MGFIYMIIGICTMVYEELIKPLKLYLIEKFIVFKHNPLLIIWFLINFYMCFLILGKNLGSLFITLIIYTISILIALSPLGEMLLRIVFDVRRVATRVEKERLIPIFKEVYKNSFKKTPYLSKYIKLYIVDDMTPNAFAIGSETIAVTRGLIETMSDEEIKGILGHEFGHISHGDTRATLIVTVGNTVFAIILILIKFVLSSVRDVFNSRVLGKVCKIIISIIDIFIFMFSFLGMIIVILNSRMNEYLADEYSSNIGYNQDLTSALYKLDSMSLTGARKISERIKISHPRIAYRIEALEIMN